MTISRARDTPIRANLKCILICLAMSMANCQYGYDTAAIAGFQAMPGFLSVYGYPDPTSPNKYNIATVPQQLISSFLNLGTILSVLLFIPLINHFFPHLFGRRHFIWLASLITSISLLLQIFPSTGLVGLYIGRLLIGISNGFYITFANIYTAEVSPAHLRGGIVSFFGIWVSIGGIFGATANNATKNMMSRHSYQIPLASLYIIPFFLSLLVFFIPESPRWLLVTGKQDEARKSLIRLRGKSFAHHPELLEEEFQEMLAGIEQEKQTSSHHERATILDLFRGTDLRRSLLCFAVILSHSSSGIWLIIAYGTFFFLMAGVDFPFLATVLKSICGLFGVCCGIFIAQKLLGRRSMMLIGHGMATLCMLGIGIANTVAPQTESGGKAIVACALIYYAFYNGFSGALSWPICSELVSSRLRVLTVGTGTGVNYVFAWLTSFTAPYFINKENLNWGASYAYIWAGSNLATFLFFYFFLPELKGRTLEEIDELFQNHVSVKNFATYQCESSTKAREIALKMAGVAEEKKDGAAGSNRSNDAKVGDVSIEHRERAVV